jgi:DNA-binding transcriptional ArsR family regulator
MLDTTSVDQVFHALGDPTRRALLARLGQGPMSVTALARPFDISLAAVVQHIQVLERSGVIRTTKVGRVRTCRLEPRGLDVAARWIDERRRLWERRLDRLGELLAAEAAADGGPDGRAESTDSDEGES